MSDGVFSSAAQKLSFNHNEDEAMRRKTLIFAFWSILLLIFSFAHADIQFHGRASNSFYAFEDTISHTRMYQLVRFTVDAPNFANATLNATFRALTDFNETLDSEQRFRAYNLNVEFSRLFKRLDLVIGRQFLHPGTVLGGLDGVYARAKLTKKLYLSAYAGVESHFGRSFKIYKFDDSFTAGGLFDIKNLASSHFQLLYLQKANKQNIFWQLAGMNISSSLIPRTKMRLQAHYDLQNSRLHRLYFDVRHQLSKKISFNLGLKNQYPQIYANSFYTIFEITPYWQYRIGASYQLRENFFINYQYQLLRLDTESANRMFFTISNLNGSFGLIYESGYAGEQIGVVFDYAYEITPQLLASINIDYSRYKTEKVYEFDHQIANALRLSYQFKKHWGVDLEYQWLTNRFKDSDSRLLNHIHFSW